MYTDIKKNIMCFILKWLFIDNVIYLWLSSENLSKYEEISKRSGNLKISWNSIWEWGLGVDWKRFS